MWRKFFRRRRRRRRRWLDFAALQRQHNESSSDSDDSSDDSPDARLRNAVVDRVYNYDFEDELDDGASAYLLDDYGEDENGASSSSSPAASSLRRRSTARTRPKVPRKEYKYAKPACAPPPLAPPLTRDAVLMRAAARGGHGGTLHGVPLLTHFDSWHTLVDNVCSVFVLTRDFVWQENAACERNFLSWVRTSISFVTLGIAVLGEFSGASITEEERDGAALVLVGKCVAGYCILLAAACLAVGWYRFFIVTLWLQRDRYPPGSASVLYVSGATISALLVTFLVTVIHTTR
ncbi:uncharacterized protein V1518DRAFT_418995 [Limtongia smithiae]|uniref:uncharacterized protein n=1 Tax=Limtongia smithiae TaxID=1125753 RepID=UPI0034CEC39E